MEKLQPLIDRLGYVFRDQKLLATALTHSSYANEGGRSALHNERLEFLGDSVLGLIAADYLYRRDKSPEGELTKLRAAVVCEKALCAYAAELELGDHLMLGKGEKRSGGAARPSILADAFEAVLAAVYLDGGMEAAQKFLHPFIEKEAANQQNTKFQDYKTILQEIIQQNPGERLEYLLTGETGPDHNKRFLVEVHLHSNVIGTGAGRSKKEAEQQAAREALKLMGY
ncbi:MAG: ribonuclease III [Oscillospiraceae bacterium]|nr:ribonuclease III [Oscillospiraceae bacterium]